LRIFHKRSAVKNRRTTSFGQEQSQSIRVLGGGRELYCVFENFTRRDLALFCFGIRDCRLPDGLDHQSIDRKTSLRRLGSKRLDLSGSAYQFHAGGPTRHLGKQRVFAFS